MDAGVQMFFLISGFLLYRPFVAAAFDGRDPTRPRVSSAAASCASIPAYWVAYIFITLYFGSTMPSAASALRRVLLPGPPVRHRRHRVDGVHTFRALGGISQSWTLVVEISFYLFFLLLRRT